MYDRKHSVENSSELPMKRDRGLKTLSWTGAFAAIAMFAPAWCQAQPAVASGGVISAGAFGAFTAVAPGSWIEIYGSNLAAHSRSWSAADFNGNNGPTSLDGTSVTIGGQPAFLDYISPGQVNVQVPSSIGTGAQPLVVQTPAGSSAAYSVTVNAQQPGLLAPGSFAIGGKQYVTAVFNDGTYVLPPGAIPGLASRRAQPGDSIAFYGVGFGSVTPDTPAGQIVQRLNTLVAPLHIYFGQMEASWSYAGLAPQAVGLYQFNVVVPNVAGGDAIPLTFSLAGASGHQTLYIPVANGTPAVQVQSLTLSATTVAGGGSVQGTVLLNAAAPAGGAAVSLSADSTTVSVPATVTVPAGSVSATFTVTANTVGANQTVNLTASYGGSSAKAALTVTPASPGLAFSQITLFLGFNPPGYESQPLGFVVQPEAGLTTFSVANSAMGWTGCISSNGNLTFTCNKLAAGYQMIMALDFSLAPVTSASMVVNLQPGAGSYGYDGSASGTFTVSGTVFGTANTNLTLSGPFTGNFELTK
jgi:uncharacterized protein (TIGR03437 family)